MRKFKVGDTLVVSHRIMKYDWDSPPFITHTMVNMIGKPVKIVPLTRYEEDSPLKVYKACSMSGVCWFFLEDWLDVTTEGVGSLNIYSVKENNDAK